MRYAFSSYELLYRDSCVIKFVEANIHDKSKTFNKTNVLFRRKDNISRCFHLKELRLMYFGSF